jgi:hypothetical protein
MVVLYCIVLGEGRGGKQMNPKMQGKKKREKGKLVDRG